MKTVQILFALLAIIVGLLLVISCTTTKNIVESEYIFAYPISKNGLWGYADKNGELVIEYLFEDAKFFSSGLAGVKKNGKYGFINAKGEFEIKSKFDSVGQFINKAAYVSKNSKSFSIDRKGRKLKNYKSVVDGGCFVPIEASAVLSYFDLVDNNFVLKETELEKLQIMDPQANFTLSSFTFDMVLPFTSKSMIVKKEDTYSVFVQYNSVGLRDLSFDEIIPEYVEWNMDGKLYESNTAKFRIGDKWGLLDGLGHITVDPEFLSIKKSDGIFYLVEYKEDHWGHITIKNRYFKM